MRNAIVNAIVYGDSFQEQITKWYKDFQTAMADGILDASEKTALNEEWNKIAKDGQDKVKAAEEAAGLNTSSSSDLSSLQQGIQSITETQASALEAIMNGVSGQVYSQTTILQNILNNSNVSLGTQSQLLLQMRESYQIQKSIQAILTGWSNNSGQAIRVELTK